MWLGMGIAASLAAIIVAGQVIPPSPQTFESGETALAVNLGRESKATLAPHSRLTIAGRDGVRLALDGGAYFDIKHDSSRSLQIVAGDLTITDVGTRFDIRERPSQLVVEVSEGEVAVQSEALAAPIQLKAGRRLAYDTAASRAAISAVDGNAVGEWRQGRLSYDSAPLQLVAADLGRYAGVQVIVPQALAQRRFSGTLFIGDGESAIHDLAQLMELDLHRNGGTYRLEPAG
jgi:transmembrane sensor